MLDYIGTSVKSRSLKLLDLTLLPSSDITNTNTGILPLFSVSPEPVIPTERVASDRVKDFTPENYQYPSGPLYSSMWMPISVGSYAGTCIFLIALAVIFRFLNAFKAVLEERWIDAELNRRYVVVIRKPNTKDRIGSNSNSKIALLTENGVEEDVVVVRKHIKGTIPWNITVDGPRAAIDTAIAGILYLL